MRKTGILLFIFLVIWASPLFAGNFLTYYIYWGPFKIGVAKIEIEKNYYKAIAYTVGLGNFFYPYYAEWKTIIDKKGMPIKSEIYSRHGKKERKKVVKFERDKGIVIYQKVLPKVEKPEIVNATYPLYDELSSFVDSFPLDYQKKPVWEFPIMVKGKRCFVRVRFEKKIACPKTKLTPSKEKCLFLRVDLPQKSELLKHSKRVELYLKEDKRYPVVIKGHLPLLGSLKGKIEKVEER